MLVRSQTVLPFRTNIPRDVVTNTMWFNTLPEMTLADAAEAIGPNLASFYSDVYTGIGGNGVQATYLNLVPAFTNFYNQDAPEPRVPYRYDLELADEITSSTRVPTEVACVLSYRASVENGVPAARRRGRIYLGGLGDAAFSASSGSSPYFPIIAPAFRTQIITAVEAWLLDPTDWGGNEPAEDINWSVFSQVDSFSAPVVAGWVDNTPDTQRRRGVNATERTSFP